MQNLPHHAANQTCPNGSDLANPRSSRPREVLESVLRPALAERSATGRLRRALLLEGTLLLPRWEGQCLRVWACIEAWNLIEHAPARGWAHHRLRPGQLLIPPPALVLVALAWLIEWTDEEPPEALCGTNVVPFAARLQRPAPAVIDDWAA